MSIGAERRGTRFAKTARQEETDMADQNAPNSAAAKDQAEGDRPEDRRTGSDAGESVKNRYDETDAGDAGISNRPIDQEVANQEALPERGEEKD
jgi:hypothetical protein